MTAASNTLDALATVYAAAYSQAYRNGGPRPAVSGGAPAISSHESERRAHSTASRIARLACQDFLAFAGSTIVNG